MGWGQADLEPPTLHPLPGLCLPSQPVRSACPLCPLWFLLMKGNSTRPETGCFQLVFEEVSLSMMVFVPIPVSHPPRSGPCPEKSKARLGAAPHPCPGPRSASSRLGSTPGPVEGAADQGTTKAQGYSQDTLVGHDEGQVLDQAGGSKEGFLEETVSAWKRQVGAERQWVGKCKWENRHLFEKAGRRERGPELEGKGRLGVVFNRRH